MENEKCEAEETMKMENPNSDCGNDFNYNINNFFSNIVYILPNGKYKALIIKGKFAKYNNDDKWVVDFKLDNRRIFQTQFKLPLNINNGFGKAVYQVRDKLNTITENCLDNNYVIIEIQNREYNNRTYSNIVNMVFNNQNEEGGRYNE